MMGNKALMSLQALAGMQGAALDAQANLEKVSNERARYVQRGGDAEAEFAGPEALATAIGAGFILGPVGGAVMGIAQGLMMRSAKQNALDAYAADNRATGYATEVIYDEIDRLEMQTENPDDLAQLSAIRSGLEMGIARGQSGFAETAALGQEDLTNAYSALLDYTQRNEEQNIAADAYEKKMQRDMDQTQYDAHQNLVARFDARMGDFETAVGIADNIIEFVNKGDGGSLTAALTTMALLGNPQAGAVSEGEVDVWKNIGGWTDSMIGRVQKELRSGGMSSPTRKELIEVARQYKRNLISSAQAIEAEFGGYAEEENIPQQFRSQYNRTGNLRVVEEGGFIKSSEPIVGQFKDIASGVMDIATSPAVEKARQRTTEFIDSTSISINDFIDETRHEAAWIKDFKASQGRQPTREEIRTRAK